MTYRDGSEEFFHRAHHRLLQVMIGGLLEHQTNWWKYLERDKMLKYLNDKELRYLWKTTSFVGNRSCLTKTTKPQFQPIQTLVRWWKTCVVLNSKMMNYIVGWTGVEVAAKDDKVCIGVVHPTNQLFHLVKQNSWCQVYCFLALSRYLFSRIICRW